MALSPAQRGWEAGAMGALWMHWPGGSPGEDGMQPLPSGAGQGARVSAAQASAAAQGCPMPAQMSVAQATWAQALIPWPKRVRGAPSLPLSLYRDTQIARARF